MNATLKHPVIVLIALLVLLTFLFFRSISTDNESYKKDLENIKLLDQHATIINISLLRTGAHLIKTYNELNQNFANFYAIIQTLKQNKHPVIGKHVEYLEEQTVLKENLVEIYKSKNALLNNSTAYFISHLDLLIKNANSYENNTELLIILSRLAAESLKLFEQNYNSFTTDYQNISIRLRFFIQIYQKINPQLAIDLEHIDQHGDFLHKNYFKVDQALDEVINFNLKEDIMTVKEAYYQVYNADLKKDEFYKKLLYINALLMLFYVAFLLRKLANNMSYLQTVNKKLTKAKIIAESANLSKNRFMANMSHELRTPLNVIIGYSELLAQDAEDDHAMDLYEDISKIHLAGNNLLNIISDVLNISEIESGKILFNQENVDLIDIIDELLPHLYDMANENNNKFKLLYEYNRLIMKSDKNKIRQILLNLLNNAFKFTKDGQVILKIQRFKQNDDDWVQIHISDTGIGIEQSLQEHIFQPFTQVDDSSTRQYGGCGLGLVLVKQYVDLMQGTILLKSTLKKGSLFKINLPIQLQYQQTSLQNNSLNPDLNKPLILIIDDDVGTQQLLKRYLNKLKHPVQFANGHEEGLRFADYYSPSIIFLDMMLPNNEAWLLLKALKIEPKLNHIPVVILSTVEQQNTGYHLDKKYTFLLKPIHLRQLAVILRKYQYKQRLPLLLLSTLVEREHQSVAKLRRSGFQVNIVYQLKDYTQLLNKQHPPLLILDLFCCADNNYIFTQALFNGDYSHLQVVILTEDGVDVGDIPLTDHPEVLTVIHKKGDYQIILEQQIDLFF